MRTEPWWDRLGSRWAQKARRFTLECAGHSLGRRRAFACLRVVGLIISSAALFAPILNRLNLAAAQIAVSGGAAEAVSPPGENREPARRDSHHGQPGAGGCGRHRLQGPPRYESQPEDFEILEDGRPQTITNFSYISTAKPAGTEAHAATPPATAGMPAVPPVRLEPEQVRRSIVILVDDLHITFQDMYYVRKALTKFIDNDVQPGDLVAILHTSGGLGVLQQFTNDKRVLHATSSALRYYMPGAWGLAGSSGPRARQLRPSRQERTRSHQERF